MANLQLTGILAAVPTPIDGSGSPDAERFLVHARWALDNGCDGLNVLGTTGEANSFSFAQRVRLMEAAAGGLESSRLMVGTGTPDAPTTIDLTRAAEDLGFAAVLVLPPYYYKGVTDEGLFRWFADVLDATGSIATYLYNFPQMSGISLSPELVRRLAESYPERISGAKDSSGDLAYARELAAIGGLNVFPSDETALAAADRDGFAGCISGSVNVTAPLAAALWQNQSDQALAEKVRAARQKITALPIIPAVKYLVSRLHSDIGFERLLPPHLPLNKDQKAMLADFEAF
ncbi:dihydrodipicolinate synthase family protein [Roseibium marinum]|uniref:4-hydroxy-tetrahydrodipicolinate synthase n=1 Tax=Roseibium marinum TaxID=281252 RepID=A0A2S3UXD5_9HYPH|nr:dihydrodipicolinate synthase family protein [Roseibium marinum]POF32392.1 4-hydroxy-tetrahydrodipicolinate synthase [Roseibium marinum]